MEVFRELGSLVESLWRGKNYSETAFPDIAARALTQTNLRESVSPSEIIRWVHTEVQLPRRQDIEANFGNPPITLYCGPRFYIDIYFWLDGTTEIHQHSFAGAFQVLTGSSIHCRYSFREKEAINEHFLLGEISFEDVELLREGDIREIIPGRQHIHSLFHLDRPSTTVAVRTFGMPSFQPQYSYRKPYLAVDPFYKEPSLIKKLQTVAMLLNLQQPGYDDLVSDLISNSDFQTTFLILHSVFKTLNSNQLEEVFQLSIGRERFASLLAKARQSHGHLVDCVVPVLQEVDRQADIIRRRQFITSTEHRFFLALLLNVPSRRKLLDLVKQRHPEKKPIDIVLDWVIELSTTKVWGSSESNVLGINDLNQDHLFLLQGLLEGRSTEELKASLEKEYSVDYARRLEARVEEMADTLRNSSLFKAILTD